MMDLAKLTKLARHRYRQVAGDKSLDEMTVPIACYVTGSDYSEICDDELSWPEHMAMLAVFAECVIKGGGHPVFVPVIAENYFVWLDKNGFDNRPEFRAKYVTWIVTGGETIDGVSGQIDDG